MALLRLHLPRPPQLPTHPYSCSSLSSYTSSWLRRARLPAVSTRRLCSTHPASPLEAAPPSIVAGLLDYLNDSWTQFHATGSSPAPLLLLHSRPASCPLAVRRYYLLLTPVIPLPPLLLHACVPAEAKRQLLDAGFKLLSESDDWDLQPGGRYFFTRNMSCLVAFAIGEK